MAEASEHYRAKRFDDAVAALDKAAGVAFAGSPASVRDWIAHSRAEAGIDYMAAELVFGDLTTDEALQCAELFGREVMPAFA